jgi:hypothetical protein
MTHTVTHRALRNDGLNHLTIPGIHLAPIPPTTIIGNRTMHHDKWWSFSDATYKARNVGDRASSPLATSASSTVIWEYAQETFHSGSRRDLYIRLYSETSLSPREKIKALFGGER